MRNKTKYKHAAYLFCNNNLHLFYWFKTYYFRMRNKKVRGNNDNNRSLLPLLYEIGRGEKSKGKFDFIAFKFDRYFNGGLAKLRKAELFYHPHSVLSYHFRIKKM